MCMCQHTIRHIKATAVLLIVISMMSLYFIFITCAAFWEIHTLRHQSAWQVIYRCGLCRLVHIKAAACTHCRHYSAIWTECADQSLRPTESCFILFKEWISFSCETVQGTDPLPCRWWAFSGCCIQHMGFRGERIKSIKMLCVLFLLFCLHVCSFSAVFLTAGCWAHHTFHCDSDHWSLL